jgi:hypothetical protein
MTVLGDRASTEAVILAQFLRQLKPAAICVRLARSRLARWVRAVEPIKVFGSTGGRA